VRVEVVGATSEDCLWEGGSPPHRKAGGRANDRGSFIVAWAGAHGWTFARLSRASAEVEDWRFEVAGMLEHTGSCWDRVSRTRA